MGRRWVGLLIVLSALTGPAFSRLPPGNPTRSPQFTLAVGQPPGPDRFTVLTVEYTAHEWWMITWADQTVECSVIVDHDGLPLLSEVSADCGTKVSRTWWEQDLCARTEQRDCHGFYTYEVGSWTAVKEIPVYLAAASASLSLENCEPVASTSTNICESAPVLVISGREPLPNEAIIGVEGELDGVGFGCDGDQCRIELRETPEDGATLEFWSYSSYGDSSEVLSARVRARQYDTGDPDQLYWYVDVLSSQWQGGPVPTCSEAWGSFAPVGGASDWLATPADSAGLSSDIPYTYLAANLIRQGAVDASACADGGLVPSGEVNQCGLEQSRAAVTDWQNQFDELILRTAQETAVPARLLKNLFARESQFWPGIYQAVGDVGLGQLTENGADTTLFWNTSFYYQFCPLILPSEVCGKGYLHLEPDEQEHLRGALVGSVNASCEGCPLGLDLSQADFSVGVFAHTLLANCSQAGQVVRNMTRGEPGAAASYEDLWKFTLVNYNAGPGCLADAIDGAQFQGLDLAWENVSQFLPPACQASIDYVNDISR